jgi:BRCA1-associated protein
MSGRSKEQRVIRRRPVSFGNPSTATYHGDVYTISERGVSQLPLVEGAMEVQKLVAMVQVAPEQVPEGILNLVRPHRPWINHIRVVIEEEEQQQEELTVPSTCASQSSQQYLSTPSSLNVSAMESAASIIANEEQQSAAATSTLQVSSSTQNQPSRTYLVLFELTSEAAADQMIQYLHGQPYTCLDETQVCSIYHVVALQGDGGVSLMSPFFAPPRKVSEDLTVNTTGIGGLEAKPAKTSTSSLSDSAITDVKPPAEDYFNCAVCLEHMQLTVDGLPSATTPTNNGGSAEQQQRTSILTTVCNHSFHIDCLVQWQDSPCPVCRYDHSGLNSALSQCSVCARTENNFVCLICGVVSCGNGSRSYASSINGDGIRATPLVLDGCNINTEQQHVNGQEPPLQIMASSHARQHYDSTLHAYALDTESQHVWDFAGQGYVHRLLQNKDDGKLVEVSDPNNASTFERTQNPGLSDSQEGEVVHRKLEGFASQYYTLLKSQLEQQRIYYEGRLEEIRREYNTSKPRNVRTTPDLIAALKQERRQLSQRLERLQQRTENVHNDVSFLKSMNESMNDNMVQFKKELGRIQQERVDYQRSFRESFPVLEHKVTQLMLQLERGESPSAL